MHRLCRQVHRRLDVALGELDDPILQGLWVRAVVAQPGSRALLVEVVVSDRDRRAQTLAHLEAARGLLRSEIAAEICRKRTPHLRFVIVTMEPIEDA